MTDINTYRCRIGLFSPKLRKNKFLMKSEYYRSFCENDDKSGEITLSVMKSTFKLVLILALLYRPAAVDTASYLLADRPASAVILAWHRPAIGQSRTRCGHGYWCYWSPGWSLVGSGWSGGTSGRLYLKREENYNINTEIIDYNFQERMKNGNVQKQKGILNMHLNIRSMKNKVCEVKKLVKEHNPHLLGLSEVELNKENIDEESLKVPGYDILFPTSWLQTRLLMDWTPEVKSSCHAWTSNLSFLQPSPTSRVSCN